MPKLEHINSTNQIFKLEKPCSTQCYSCTSPNKRMISSSKRLMAQLESATNSLSAKRLCSAGQMTLNNSFDMSLTSSEKSTAKSKHNLINKSLDSATWNRLKIPKQGLLLLQKAFN